MNTNTTIMLPRQLKKVSAKTDNKQSYMIINNKNHCITSATDCFGETPYINGILCLLSEKLEKEFCGQFL